MRATYGLSAEDACVLISVPGLADYYEEAAAGCGFPQIVASLLLNELLRFSQGESFSAPVSAKRLAELAELTGDRTVNRSTAKKLLLRLTEQDGSPREIAERDGMTQVCDPERIKAWVGEVLASDVKSVSDYRNGKTNAFRALQGKLMAKSGGRADPVLAEQLLLRALKQEREEL